MNISESAAKAVTLINEKCYSLDIKGNNCQLDRIMRDFLIEIGQPELEKAFKVSSGKICVLYKEIIPRYSVLSIIF